MTRWEGMISAIGSCGVEEFFAKVCNSLGGNIAFGQESHAFIIFVVPRKTKRKERNGELVMISPLSIDSFTF